MKVKWSRYRFGVAQRVSRGIAILFHDRSTRSWWMVSSTPGPHFTPGKDPVPILQEAGWAAGPVWTSGESRPHPWHIYICPVWPEHVTVDTLKNSKHWQVFNSWTFKSTWKRTAILLPLSVSFIPSDLKYHIAYRPYLLKQSVSRLAVLNDCLTL